MSNTAFATRLFLGAGRIAARLPRIRGKTRLLLALYKFAGLQDRHVSVQACLSRPVAFGAQLDLHSWLQRVAFITGGYEEDTVEFLIDLHRRDGQGGYLLDVGANIGLISIPFVRKTASRAVAVEAVPDNVAVLRKNIELNGLEDSLRIVPFALGATAGRAQIQVEGDLRPGEGTGTANILPDGSAYECVRQEIAVRTLDDLAASGELPERCAVMKIDTDGYDLKVLQGGPRFLTRHRCPIFGEFSAHCLAWHQQTSADVIAFAQQHDYVTWFRLPRSWKFTREAPAAFEQDLLLIPAESIEKYESLLERSV